MGDVPWHGLGLNLPAGTVLTPLEAMERAGLGWTVSKREICVGDGERAAKKYAIVRDDNQTALGVVGSQYRLYQNADLFRFMDSYCERAGVSMVSCGALDGGKTVWGLSRASGVEYLKGDPVDKYLLMTTSHDGHSQVEILFTDVRVVCNNALSAAFLGGCNKVSIRRMPRVRENMDDAGNVLSLYAMYQERLSQVMGRMVGVKLDGDKMFGMAKKLMAYGPKPKGVKEGTETENKRALAKAEKVMGLVESGKGTDIPGVRGTAYGFLNAVTEYVDHHMEVRGGKRDVREAKFESALLGVGAKIKQDAFDACSKLAA
jgi:phage/plasmid-like protein (TIGR03299 family)